MLSWEIWNLNAPEDCPCVIAYCEAESGREGRSKPAISFLATPAIQLERLFGILRWSKRPRISPSLPFLWGGRALSPNLDDLADPVSYPPLYQVRIYRPHPREILLGQPNRSFPPQHAIWTGGGADSTRSWLNGLSPRSDRVRMIKPVDLIFLRHGYRLRLERAERVGSHTFHRWKSYLN